MSNKSDRNYIQSVDRAMQILDVFNNKNKEMGVTEIAKTLALHKSTTFGLLSTLEHKGMIEQNPENGKYKLGLKLFELGNLVKEGMDLRTLTYPFLKELVNEYQETVHLVIHDKGEAVYIDKIEGTRAISMISQIGKRFPMYSTGVGKLILAYEQEDYVNKYVLSRERHKFTSNTIVDKDKLMAELEKIRNQGYAIDFEEMEKGLRCIAAPIRNHKGNIIAAFSISGPSTRMSYQLLKELVEPMKQTARLISQRLGYSE